MANSASTAAETIASVNAVDLSLNIEREGQEQERKFKRRSPMFAFKDMSKAKEEARRCAAALSFTRERRPSTSPDARRSSVDSIISEHERTQSVLSRTSDMAFK